MCCPRGHHLETQQSPVLLCRETVDKARSAGTAFTGKKGILLHKTFIRNWSNHTGKQQLLSALLATVLEGIFPTPAKPLECSRVEWGPTMQCPSYHPWSKQGPPCLLLLTKRKKTAPRQAQPLRSSNPRMNLAHRIQKNRTFQTLRRHQQNCQ